MSHSPSRHPVTCVAAIIHHAGKVLIGTRVAGNIPCLPGGKVDWNETVEDAVVREVKEECDLDVAIVTLAGYTNDIWREEESHYVTLFFHCTVTGGAVRVVEPHKITDFRWLAANDVPRLYAGGDKFIAKPPPPSQFSIR